MQISSELNRAIVREYTKTSKHDRWLAEGFVYQVHRDRAPIMKAVNQTDENYKQKQV